MSETIDDGTLANANFGTITDGTFGNYNISAFGVSTAYPSIGSGQDEYLTVGIEQATFVATTLSEYDTESTPTIILQNGQIQDPAGAGGNSIGSPQGAFLAEDDAPPAIIYSITRDTDSNGLLDEIEITLSENIVDGASLGTSNFVVDGYTDTGVITGTINDDQVTITITELTVSTPGDPSEYDTEAVPDVDLNFGELEDAEGNSIAALQEFNTTDDGAAPVIVDAVTVDATEDGQVERIDVRLSEDIDDDGSTGGVGLAASNFTITGYTINTVTTGMTGDDTDLQINFTVTGSPTIADYDTEATPDITLNDGEIADDILVTLPMTGPNVLSADQVFTATEDGAAPIIVAAETEDSDSNPNGFIDRIHVTLSEPIDDDGGSALANGGIFSVTGYSLDGTTEVVTGTSVDDEFVTIQIDELGGVLYDTDAIPNIVLEEPSNLVDATGNQITMGDQTFSGTTDEAAPVIVDAVTADTEGNPDGKIDFITVTFSENIDDSESTVTGSMTVAGYGVAGIATNSVDGDELEITLTEISSGGDTDATPQLTLVTGQISDQPAGAESVVTDRDQTFTPRDGAAPAIINAITIDTDGNPNGLINDIQVTLSEAIDDNAIDTDLTDNITISDGYTISGVTTGTGNDAVVTLNLTEGSGPSSTGDTDATPTLTVATGEISDGTNVQGVAQTFVTIDNVGPAIVGAQTEDEDDNGKIDHIYLTFSEPIDDNTLGVGNADFSTPVETGFTYAVLGTETNQLNGTSSANDEYVSIVLSENPGTALADYDSESTPTINLIASAIDDLATSAISSTSQTLFQVTDNAGPAIIYAETNDDDLDGKIDEIHLTMSENVDDGSLGAAGFTVSNFTVSGGTNMYGVPTVNSEDAAGTADTGDDEITLVFAEGTLLDTDAVPDVTMSSLSAVTDGSNSINSNQTFIGTVDEVAPYAKTLFPGDGTTSAVNIDPVITFDTDVFDGGGTLTLTDLEDGSSTRTIAVASTTIVNNVVTIPLSALSSGGLDSLDYGTNYQIDIPSNAFEDSDGNPYIESVTNLGTGAKWNFTTEADSYPPTLLSITEGGGTTPLGTFASNAVSLRLTFTEEVRVTAGQNGNITLYYQDENYELFNAQVPFTINTHNNSNSGGSGTTFITTDLSTSTYARIIEIDLDGTPALPTDAIFAGGASISIGMVEGAFSDAAGNLSTIVNQSNNEYTFDIADNGTLPEVLGYGLITPSSLGSDLYIDFSEPVDAAAGTNIHVTFNDDDVVDFSLDATDGVATNGDTRYTFTIPENLKGSNTYYIDVDVNAFNDQDGGNNNLAAFDGDAEITGFKFTAVSDAIAPFLTGISPNDGNSAVIVGTNDIELTFDEPVTLGSGDIKIFYSDGELFSTIDLPSEAALLSPNISAAYATGVDIDLSGILDDETNSRTLKPGQEFYIEIEASAFIDRSTIAFDEYTDGGLIATGKLNYQINDDTSTPYIITKNDPTTHPDFDPALGDNDVVTTDPIIIEFQEAVNPVASTYVRIHYTTGDEEILRWDASDGVASDGKTVYTYSLSDVSDGPSYLSGNTDYYIMIDDGAFQDIDNDNFDADDGDALVGWDGAGNAMSTSTWTFTTDDELNDPTFTFSPIDGSTSVNPVGNLVLTFDKRVTAGTSEDIRIYFDDGDGNMGNDVVAQTIAANVVSPVNTADYTGSVFTYTLALSGNTNYYLNMDVDAFQDANGTPNTTPVINDLTTYNFTTNAEMTDPDLIVTNPILYNGLTPTNNPDPTSAITLTMIFDERVEPSTGDIWFEYDDTESNEVYRFEAGTGIIDNATNTPGSRITYTIPANTFRGGNDYTLGVDASAFEDASGNFFAGFDADGTNSVTTLDDNTNPVLLSHTPVDGAVDHVGTTDLVLTFDEPVNLETSGNITVYYATTDEAFAQEIADEIDMSVADANNANRVTRSISNTTVTISGYALERDLDYYVQIDNSIFSDNDDANGGAANIYSGISDKSTWNFSTITLASTTPTDVTSVVYEQIAAGDDNGTSASGVVNLRHDIYLNFDEPVFITNKDITLSPDRAGLDDIVINALDDTQVINELGIATPTGEGTHTIRINPDDDLHGNDNGGNTTYTVTVPSGTFEDGTGNAIADSWTFTTSPAVYPSDDNTVALGNLPEMIACLNLNDDPITLQEAIYIKESSMSDFRTGNNQTLVFTLSSDFQFVTANDVQGTNVIGNGADITINDADIATNTITIDYSISGATSLDNIEITGIQIIYTGTSTSATGTIIRTGGTGDVYGMSVSHQTNILDIQVESINAPDIVGSSAPGDVVLTNVTFCEANTYIAGGDASEDNWDNSYTPQNSFTHLTVGFEFDAGGTYTYRIYRDANLADQVGTDHSGTSSASTFDFDDFFEATDYDNAGDELFTQNTVTRYITYINPNGCESEPTQIDFTVYDLPNPEFYAGHDYDDDDEDASVSPYGSVCGDEEITIGDVSNNTLSGFTFYWYGQDVGGAAVNTSSGVNPTFNVPFNNEIATDSIGSESTGFRRPKQALYFLDVSDANGCHAHPNQNAIFDDGGTQRQARVEVWIDREVPVDIFSENGLTFTETQTTAQPIYGDFAFPDDDNNNDDMYDVGEGVNEVAPETADMTLEIQSIIGTNLWDYTVNPYSSKDPTSDAIDGYTGVFSGVGLGATDLNGINYHKVNFTPSAVGSTGNTVVTYTLTEDFTGCEASVSETILIVADQNTVFVDLTGTTDDVFATYQTSKLIASSDDGSLDTYTSPVIEELFATDIDGTDNDFVLTRFEGPGVYGDNLKLVVADASGFSATSVIVGDETGALGTVESVSGNEITLNLVEGTFDDGSNGNNIAETVSLQAGGGTTLVSYYYWETLYLRLNSGGTGTFAVSDAVNSTNITGTVARVITDPGNSDVILHVSGVTPTTPASDRYTVGGTVTNGSGATWTIEEIYGDYYMNLATAFNDETPAADFLVVNSDGTKSATVKRVVRQTATGNDFEDGSKEVVLAPLPTVTFNNVEDAYCDIDPDNVNQSLAILIDLVSSGATTPNNTGQTLSTYNIEVNDADVDQDAQASQDIASGTIDFADLIDNIGGSITNIGLTANDTLTESAITYTLTITTPASYDPLYSDLSNFGSPVTIQKDFTLYRRQPRPELDLSGGTNRISDISSTMDRDYIVEYCQFETIGNVVIDDKGRHGSGDVIPTDIKWYQDNSAGDGKGDEIAVPDGRDVAAFTLFGTSTPDPGTYVFRFTQTSNEGGGFDGCESDFSTLTYIIHDIPTKPRLDIVTAGSTTGEEQGTVPGKWVFEYCDGDAVDDLIIHTGDIAVQNFATTPYTATAGDWNIVTDDGDGAYSAGALELEANEVVESQYLDLVNEVTFKAWSAGGAGTLEIRYMLDEASPNSFEVLETISLTNVASTEYTYTIETFNDPDITSDNAAIRFVAGSNGGEIVYIDDFSASSMIDDQAVYDWWVHNGTNYVLIDGFNLDANGTTLDANDGVGEGYIMGANSAGNRTALAAELFTAYDDLLSPATATGDDNTPPPGTYTFYVSRREDINYDNTVNFDGCESDKTEIEINVYSIPGTPSGGNLVTDLNASSGGAPTTNNDVTYNDRILPTDDIFSVGADDIGYRWYYDNTTAEQTGAEFADLLENATIDYQDATTIFSAVPTSTSGHYSPTSTLDADLYLAQVSPTSLDRKTASGVVTSFVGCETPAASRQRVDITIYPIDEIPVIGAVNYQNNLTYYDEETPTNVGEPVEISFKASELSSTETFYAQTFYSDGTNSQKFHWYFSDASGTRNTAQEISVAHATGAEITASEMLIAGITNNSVQYFLVTQDTDIEPSSGYEGSESEGTLLRINIYNTPDAPSQNSSTSSSDPGTLNFYYCDDESVADLTVKSYDESSPSDIIFYWYQSLADAQSQDSTKRLSTADVTGATITPAEMLNDDLSFADDNGNTSTPANMSGTVPPGTYTFYATQSSNKMYNNTTNFSGDPFFGVESDPLTLTIYIRDIPIAPAVIDQTLLICEDDATPTFSISGFDPKITYKWYDSLSLTTTLATGQNFTPQNVTDNSTTTADAWYDYRVTQTTDINLNNEGFVGCESPVTDLTLTVRKTPSAPATTGVLDTDNNYYVYEICEGDDIPTFALANPDLTRQTAGIQEYVWYDQDNNELNATSSETFNVSNLVDVSNLTPEVANDFTFRVTQRTNINSSESFDGCISDFTNVVLRINGLPSLSFNNIADNNAYCLELDSIDFSAGPLGIAGTGVFSLYDNFGAVGTGLTDNGDGTARLKLSDLHLTDDDSLTKRLDTERLTVGGLSTFRNVYFKYTDTKGCVNTDSVTNIAVDPFPAIDFKIDDNIVDEFFTCLNEEDDIFAERTFFLEGFYSESGASIAKEGERSDFQLFDNAGNELEVGILSDLDAVANFSPLEARRSLSDTDETIRKFDPTTVYTVDFTHTDENGCTNVVDADITVYPLPQFENTGGVIIANKACASETVEFEVDLVNMDDNLATFSWFVENDVVTADDDIDGDNTDDNVKIFTNGKFTIGGGPKTMVVRATADATGCVNEETETKSIGVVPTPRFKWDNITAGIPTTFTFEERSLDSRFSEYNDVDLTIKDGSGNVVSSLVRDRADFTADNRDMLNDYSFTFSESGIYKGTFYLNSSASCDSTIVRDFNVLEQVVVPATGILHTFDNSNDGWHTDSISVDRFYDGITDTRIDDEQASVSILRYSTWEWETPAGKTLNLTRAPSNVSGRSWITNADGRYGSKGEESTDAENSWVYSPAFDLSGLEKPSMSFNYASHLLNTDGVVVQYSVDNGLTWGTVGEFDFTEGSSGINWYTFLGLPGNPGNVDDATQTEYNKEQLGWTSETDVNDEGQGRVAEDFYWYFAANKIDGKDIDGNYLIDPVLWSNIRFRFALGSRPSFKQDASSNDLEGFVFDNFRIFDRSKVVLFESFASTMSDISIEADSIIQDRVAKTGPGTVWINYFTELDGEIFRPTDSLFLRNELDPSARGGFYGISEVPTSVLDGEVIEKFESDSRANELLGWNQFALNKKELVEPEFDIHLEEQPTTTTDEIRISGTFTSLVDLPANSELSFRFVIMEDYITNKEFGNYVASDTIRNVMRKILPDASGYIEKKSIAVGETFNYDVEWTIDAIYNLDQLKVVAFVQNEVTRDIYQVAFIEIDGKANTVTGVRDDLERGDPFELYPNPADDFVTVEFSRGWNIEVDWTIYDQSGRVVKEGILDRKQRELKLRTGELPSGVYMLQLNHDKYKWEPKRLMILHD